MKCIWHETPRQGSTNTLTILGQYWDKYHPPPPRPPPPSEYPRIQRYSDHSRTKLYIPRYSDYPGTKISWSTTKTQWSINFLCWSKCEKHGDHSYWIVSCPDAMHVHMRGSGYTSPNPLACFRM